MEIKLLHILISGCTLVILVMAWSYLIERKLIVIRKTIIDTGFTADIALISDLHLGKWKDEAFLSRVVAKINQQDIDYVFIAGDFTYEPTPNQSLRTLFAPLSEIKVPVYAVLGNHDVGKPGPELRDDLAETLKSNGVTLLHNESVELKNFSLLGLGDSSNNEDDTSLIGYNDKEIVLTHNPDTTLRYTDTVNLTLTGHTHCGQVKIPLLYKYVIPTVGAFYGGFSQERNTQLYITCGLGEVSLPLRLFNPPVIDVLTLR